MNFNDYLLNTIEIANEEKEILGNRYYGKK